MSVFIQEAWNNMLASEAFQKTFQVRKDSSNNQVIVAKNSDVDIQTVDSKVDCLGEGSGMKVRLPPTSPKCLYRQPMQKQSPNTSGPAVGHGIQENLELEDKQMKLLAQDGPIDVWLFSYAAKQKGTSQEPRAGEYIVRELNEKAIQSNQSENEVAWLKYISKHESSIPVPATIDSETFTRSPFIAIEHFKRESLSSTWGCRTVPQKWAFARAITNIIIGLGEITFDSVSGLTLAHTIGPEFEEANNFEGKKDCQVGPHGTLRAFILACLSRDIDFYTHTSTADVNWDLVEDTSRSTYINMLKHARLKLLAGGSAVLQGQAVVVHAGTSAYDAHVVVPLDWELLGIHPINEILGAGVHIVEMEDDEDEDQDTLWTFRVASLVKDRARQRAWQEENMQALFGM